MREIDAQSISLIKLPLETCFSKKNFFHRESVVKVTPPLSLSHFWRVFLRLFVSIHRPLWKHFPEPDSGKNWFWSENGYLWKLSFSVSGNRFYRSKTCAIDFSHKITPRGLIFRKINFRVPKKVAFLILGPGNLYF